MVPEAVRRHHVGARPRIGDATGVGQIDIGVGRIVHDESGHVGFVGIPLRRGHGELLPFEAIALLDVVLDERTEPLGNPIRPRKRSKYAAGSPARRRGRRCRRAAPASWPGRPLLRRANDPSRTAQVRRSPRRSQGPPRSERSTCGAQAIRRAQARREGPRCTQHRRAPARTPPTGCPSRPSRGACRRPVRVPRVRPGCGWCRASCGGSYRVGR